MSDFFDDVPLASAEIHEGVRKILEERLPRDNFSILVPSPHMDMTAMMLADVPPLLIVVGGEPGLGKTYHHNPTLRESGAEREVREELGYGRGLMGLGYNGMGVYDYMEDRFYPYNRFDYPVLADDKKLPEWQQRRNRSKDAKQALIDQLKAKRK